MNAYNSKAIDTNDIAQRVINELSDFHSDGLITGSTLRSRTNYTNLLKAINTADREVCRDSQIHRLVVVYAPPGQSSIPFEQNHQYLADIRKGIQDEDLATRHMLYFINKHDYINVVEIFSRYIDVFSKYPTGSESPSRQIRKVGNSELRGIDNQSTSENKATFIADENRLILGTPLKEGGFLRFEGRIWPGVFNTFDVSDGDRDKDKYNAYKIVAPHTAHTFLVGAAVYHSLPISAQKARAVAGQSMSREKRDYLKMKPSDSNVVVPHFHL